MKKRAMGVLLGVALAVLVPTVAMASRPERAESVVGALAGYDRARGDVLGPDTVADLEGAQLIGTRARLLRSDDTTSYYVAPSKSGMICLVTVLQTDEGEVAASGCNSPDAVRRYGLPVSLRAGDIARVAVVAPDGYDQAMLDSGRSMRIENNIVVFESNKGIGALNLTLSATDQSPIHLALPASDDGAPSEAASESAG